MANMDPTGIKQTLSAGLHSFLEMLGENWSISLPLPISRGCPHCLASGFFFHFHSKKLCISLSILPCFPLTVIEFKLLVLISRQASRNSDFVQKAGGLRRWWTCIPKNHLTQLRFWLLVWKEGKPAHTFILSQWDPWWPSVLTEA